MTGIELASGVLERELQALSHEETIVTSRPCTYVSVKRAQRHVTEMLGCIAVGVVVVPELPSVGCKVILHAVVIPERIRVGPGQV